MARDDEGELTAAEAEVGEEEEEGGIPPPPTFSSSSFSLNGGI